MVLEMKVPSPGESISEVEIATWLVQDGDYVEKDQAIAEVDSDKATLELPAEESGIITLKAEEGDVVAVGQVVCLIDTDGKPAEGSAPSGSTKPAASTSPASPASPAPAPAAQPAATYATGTPSPAARKILDEKGIQLSSGSGVDGRVTKEDAIIAAASMGTQGSGDRPVERKRLSSLRRKLAQRLVSVKNETAMLTTFNEVNMQPVFDVRNEYKEAFKAKHGVGLGFMSFFTKATVKALQAFPEVNSMIDGQEQVVFGYCDISVAVSGPKGLMVPVVRNAENLDFPGIEKEIARLAVRVRDGEITVDEMTGGTFTISNGGVFGSMLSTPIINPPQSAILGMHNIVERPVAENGQVVIRPVMYLALSYDHRVIDGRESVGFLKTIKEALENPIEELFGGVNQVKKALDL
jgi:2-oxoglutarate dehydrogenase E2 component (dihydrolipoamide succinyltransferase)